MLVRTYVNKAVYEKLKAGEVVKPVLGKGYNREGIVKMYDVLKEASGFESFFFGMQEGSTTIAHADDLCKMSSEGNEYGLIIDVPEDELFPMAYYTYSDMLYFNEFHSTQEDIDYVNFCKNAIINKDFREGMEMQIIYKEIDPKNIVKFL